MPTPSNGPWGILAGNPGNIAFGGPQKGGFVKKRALVLGLAAVLIASPMAANADSQTLAGEADDLAMVWDLLVVRPVAIAAMAAGAILYVPAALLTDAGNNDIKPVEDALLKAPYRFAIERPLGRFDD